MQAGAGMRGRSALSVALFKQKRYCFYYMHVRIADLDCLYTDRVISSRQSTLMSYLYKSTLST